MAGENSNEVAELEARVHLLELRAREAEAKVRFAEAQEKLRARRPLGTKPGG